MYGSEKHCIEMRTFLPFENLASFGMIQAVVRMIA